MDHGVKRKADGNAPRGNEKRQKTKKTWRVPRKHDQGSMPPRVIQPGDSGIWATCDKGREGKCVNELRDLFTQYAEQLYGQDAVDGPSIEDTIDNGTRSPMGIESDIQAEIAELHQPHGIQLFTPLRVDVQCVVFFKTVAPVEPVAFVKKICEDAIRNPERKRTRFGKRLSPMSLIGRASAEGLEKVATEVLAPHFHLEPFQRRKFAIRPTLRNHNTLTREIVIKQVAAIVGPGHEVDLKDYDLLIVVELYQNVCGVSVLDGSFERLKRFNLAEIFDPTPKDVKKQVSETEVGSEGAGKAAELKDLITTAVASDDTKTENA